MKLLFLLPAKECKKMKKILLMFVIGYSITADSQTLPSDFKNKIADKKSKKILFTPDQHSNFYSWISQISLTAQQKDKKGNFNLDYKNKSNTDIFHFGASQALTEGSSEVTPFNLEGISNGTAVKLGFTHFFWKPQMSTVQRRNFEDVRKKHFEDSGKADDPLITYDSLYTLLTDIEKNRLAKSKVFSHPLLFNVLYRLEKNSFEFVTDSAALVADQQSQYAHTFTAGLTYFFRTAGKTQQLLNFSASVSSNYNPGKKISLIVPFGTTRNYFSEDIILGAPKRQTDEILAAEYRIGINNDNQESTFALGAAIDYSIQKKLLAFQLPIYFLRGNKEDKITGLQGGIRLGYLTSTKSGEFNSFKNGFSAELVITEPFDIFK